MLRNSHSRILILADCLAEGDIKTTKRKRAKKTWNRLELFQTFLPILFFRIFFFIFFCPFLCAKNRLLRRVRPYFRRPVCPSISRSGGPSFGFSVRHSVSWSDRLLVGRFFFCRAYKPYSSWFFFLAFGPVFFFFFLFSFSSFFLLFI